MKYFADLIKKQLSTEEHVKEEDDFQKKMISYTTKDRVKKLDDHIIIPVYGEVGHGGKSSLILELVKSTNESKPYQITIDLQEPFPDDVCIGNISVRNHIESYNVCRLALLTLSKDINDWHLKFFEELINTGTYVIIVLTKIDKLYEHEVCEIKQNVKKKIQPMLDCQRCALVCTAASPLSHERIIKQEDGTEIVDLFQPLPDCNELIHCIEQYILAHSKQSSVKFTNSWSYHEEAH